MNGEFLLKYPMILRVLAPCTHNKSGVSIEVIRQIRLPFYVNGIKKDHAVKDETIQE